MKVIRNKSILIIILFMFFTYSNPITVFAAQNVEVNDNTLNKTDIDKNQELEENRDLNEIKMKYQSELQNGLDNIEDIVRITDVCNKLYVDDIKIIKSWTSEFLYKPEYFYLQGYNLDYNYYQSTGELESMTFVPKYRDNDKEKIINYRTELNNKIEEIINSEIKEGYSDFQKEYAIVNYLLKNCQYDYEGYYKDDIKWECFTVYGALVNNLCVCQGYAESLKLLLNACGIYCEVVTGTAGEKNEGHAWNIVNIDGKYYQIDTTWMDTEGGEYKFEYFNLSDEKMSQNHYYDKTNINQSINDDFNFFNNNIKLSSYNNKTYDNETELMYFLEDNKIISKDIYGDNKKIVVDDYVTNITGIFDGYLVYTEVMDNYKILVRLNLFDNTKTVIKVLDKESVLLCTLTESTLKIVSYNKDDTRDTIVFDLFEEQFEDSNFFKRNDIEDSNNKDDISEDKTNEDKVYQDKIDEDKTQEDNDIDNNYSINDTNNENKNDNTQEDIKKEEESKNDISVKEDTDDKDKQPDFEDEGSEDNNDYFKGDTSKEDRDNNTISGSKADTGDNNVVYFVICSMICSLYFLKKEI